MDDSNLTQTASLLQKNWGLSQEFRTDPDADGWDQLKVALRLRLQEMLEDDFAGLVNAMYRLDVNENLFRQALAAGSVTEASRQLTEVVLERELKRLETRRKYNNPDQTST